MTVLPFTVGADPELFVRDKKTKKLVSCHGLIPGDKKNPYKVDSGAIQVDGLAAEFNIEPCRINDIDTWEYHILEVMKNLRRRLGEKDCEIVIQPAAEFEKEYYDSLSDEEKELGCDPDFCAYTSQANPRPNGDSGLRTASGHIHIGWGKDIPQDHPDHLTICESFVKSLDVYCGLYSVIIDPDTRRRTMYGMAGAYRPKPYGVEYRVPSNVWLRSRTTRVQMHHLVSQSITDMKNGGSQQEWCKNNGYDVREIINSSDVTKAKQLLGCVYGRCW